ncbi:rhodanese-like domain-containing protein [Bacillus sp. OK048]|uniref:rhodanese-like domain-containing protein n=1 Tax=Bacillus sp. OK048 TaxID=1882761 RepID=UPI0008897CDD|nr:rhodanese-like domain-containing protein [Bacillus sp. OK048]SDN21975.1 thiosulfate/3-mercaptopyruvate sulfurtransferase [Bacillus sp. OK048]
MFRGKRNPVLLIMLLLLAILSVTACNSDKKDQPTNKKSDEAKTAITTEELQEKLNDDSWVVVDTRINDAFNGWKLDGVERGGHIAGAVDFSANWLKVEADNKEKTLDTALETKGISSDKNIVLYDANGTDTKKVAEYLKGKGYENVFTYDVKEWAKDESLPMENFENYHMIVPASVVNDIIDGKTPETFEEGKKVKIVEASWGEEKDGYANGHVPGSFHINTDDIEPPPAWMLASDKELEKVVLNYGFTKDDSVIVTSESQMAAYRVAVALRYVGIEDVRVLNGGLGAWTAAGYEVETTSHKPKPVTDFGASIPGNPDLIDTIEEVKTEVLANPEKNTLVDNRTWEERIGETSGYSYHDKKGRIPGSVYGYAGLTDANSLENFRNIDNTMRNFDEIVALWKEEGIDLEKDLSFMCGSGWRAAEVLTYAQVYGLNNSSLYSDGWIGWSNNPSNPVETGEE